MEKFCNLCFSSTVVYITTGSIVIGGKVDTTLGGHSKVVFSDV